MKAKWTTLLPAIPIFLFIFMVIHSSGLAAPTGELTMVSPMIGNEIPVPWMEQAHSNDWMKLLYDPLVGTTSDAKRSTEAGLAEKWEMSSDGLIWTFHIRKGVKFHDGTELTAKDAKFSIEKAMASDSRAHNAGNLKHAIKSMELKDPYTLVVYCKNPYFLLPDGLFSDIGGPGGSVLPKDYYERVGYDKFVKNPIGTGPYKFHSQIQGSFIKLEATDKHWRDGTPRYKYVTFRIIQEDGTRIAMLKTGEADISRIGRESVKDLQNAGLNVVSKKNAAIVMFQFNIIWESPAFSDVRFRKAINLAIDREAIIKHIFGNMASPTATYPGANIFGVGGVPNLTPYPYAPAEARKLIKEGRYEGYEFPVPNYSRPGCPELSRVVEASCGYWEKIGVKPKIFNIEYPKYGEMRRTQKTSGHLSPHDSMTCSALPELMQLFRENLHSAAPRTNAKDPKVDQMIERAEKSLDRVEVEKLLVDLYRYSYDNYVFVPICDIHDEIAVNKRVPKWEPGSRRADRNLNEIIRQR